MKFPRIATYLTAFTLAVAATVTGLSPSYAAVNDIDGDKIPDSWEQNGKDLDGDGTIDLDFPTWGASPYKKDIFVEMDYMPGLLASDAELARITNIFASYPVSNPDGTTGINIHLDAGDARSAQYNLGGGNEIEHQPLEGMNSLETIKSTNMDQDRNGIFHYMIWGDYYGNGGSSGLGYINGLGFMVTVGPTYWGSAAPDYRVGTFVHELGHNLGLLHGGNDNVNYKPNYLSVMNYSYQLSGVPHSTGKYFGYSVRQTNSLDENALSERAGFGPGAIGYIYNRLNANKNIDYNGNGTIDADPVQKDLNGDKQFSVLSGPNDMNRINFQPRIAAEGVTPPGYTPPVAENELTYEDAVKQNLVPEQELTHEEHNH